MVAENTKTRTETADIKKLPSGWTLGKLTDVTESESDIVAGPFGSNLKVSDYKNSGVPIIRLQNIGPNTFIPKDIKYISEKKANELNYHSFVSGDVILAKLGDPIGISCIVPKFMKFGIVVADVVRIRVSQKKADKYFIVQTLNSPYCLNQLNASKIGSTRPRVNLPTIRKIRLYIPPLFEQHEVAKILSNTDSLIESLDKLITKKKNIKQGLMQTLLTRGIGHTKFKKTEIGEIPEEWVTKKFHEILATVKGNTPKNLLKYDKNEKLLPYLSAEYLRGHYKRVKYCFIEDDKRITTVDVDDIIVIWDGNAGEFFSGMKGILSSTMAKLIFKDGRISREFIYYFLKKCEGKLKSTTKGSTIPHLDGNTLSDLDVLLPTFQEQQKIAKILSDADKEIEVLKQKRDKYKLLKVGMMQQLLTGGIRVK